jgi:hypothetical protein
MTEQNDNIETVEIRFIVTGRPDEMKILAAKWMRSNKTEAIEFLAQGKKPDIIASNGASPDQVHWAKIESAAFCKYLTEALSAQIAAEEGGSFMSNTPAEQKSPSKKPVKARPEITTDLFGEL